MIRVTIIIVATLLSVFRLGFADYCSICVHDYCQTTYPTDNDGDGDGMSDVSKIHLANKLKSSLYLDCSNLEIMEMMDISMSNGSFRWILTEQSLEKTSPSPSNPESLKLKDPNVAAFYALVPGFFVHGAGHFYGGDSRTGTILLCTETFSFIVLFGFFGRAIEELSGDAVTFMKGPNIRLGAGLVLFLGSWYYDIFHSPKAAKAYNEKLLTKKRVGLKINPSGINIVFEFN